MNSATVTIQIGNSDDKLTQKHWSQFVNAVENAIAMHGGEIHFFGGSANHLPWQNCCWVAVVEKDQLEKLRDNLRVVARSYLQDSIAFTVGETFFV